MDINIRGDKLTASKAIKDYINEKIGKLDKYFENPKKIKANVVIRSRDDNKIIEVTVPTPKFTLRREEAGRDLYAAIDLVADKLERQIRKNKTKIKNKYRSNIQGDIISDFEIKEEEEENTLKIVKVKNIDSKPMDEEEAVLQMELLNHDFFVFKNINEECVSVVYKRKDNNYGIINVK